MYEELDGIASFCPCFECLGNQGSLGQAGYETAHVDEGQEHWEKEALLVVGLTSCMRYEK